MTDLSYKFTVQTVDERILKIRYTLNELTMFTRLSLQHDAICRKTPHDVKAMGQRKLCTWTDLHIH